VTSTAGFGNVPGNWQFMGFGDFNGDGRHGHSLAHNNTGTVAIWFLNSSGNIQSTASVGAVPIATTWTIAETGDFDGNGKADILWIDGTGNVAIWFMTGATIASTASLAMSARPGRSRRRTPSDDAGGARSGAYLIVQRRGVTIVRQMWCAPKRGKSSVSRSYRVARQYRAPLTTTTGAHQRARRLPLSGICAMPIPPQVLPAKSLHHKSMHPILCTRAPPPPLVRGDTNDCGNR